MSPLDAVVGSDCGAGYARAVKTLPFCPSSCRPNEQKVPLLLDNAPLITGRYIAHAAIACRDIAEAADWYSTVIGARPVRILEDRVTLTVGGVLQLVCHLHPEFTDPSPRPYPRHFGLTFLDAVDYSRMKAHIESIKQPFLLNPMTRFPLNKHEHQSFMLADPSGNVVEFKWYVNPDFCY